MALPTISIFPSTTPVISTDFYPTMLEMAGLPQKSKQHVDGVSLVPLLKQTGSIEREAIYWHYPHYGNQGGSPGSAVRTPKRGNSGSSPSPGTKSSCTPTSPLAKTR